MQSKGIDGRRRATAKEYNTRCRGPSTLAGQAHTRTMVTTTRTAIRITQIGGEDQSVWTGRQGAGRDQAGRPKISIARARYLLAFHKLGLSPHSSSANSPATSPTPPHAHRRTRRPPPHLAEWPHHSPTPAPHSSGRTTRASTPGLRGTSSPPSQQRQPSGSNIRRKKQRNTNRNAGGYGKSTVFAYRCVRVRFDSAAPLTTRASREQ